MSGSWLSITSNAAIAPASAKNGSSRGIMICEPSMG
jgi:hypothetical protein